MTQNAEAAPELIAGRYQLERVIARGGMGVVYLAQQVMLNRSVALKVLAPPVDVDDGSSFEERFRLEAETLAALDHRNIVTLFDYGQMPDGRFFLALEFIDGPRFTDLLRSGTLTIERTVKLLLQVCSALRYAHKRGVVHRDLKPSNLLIRRDDDGEECVKVVDFGLVKVMEQDHEITRAGLILGSPHCMAPEQIQSQAIDHRCDIYALGVLLFRSLTGKWPFHADTGTATMVSHIKDPVPRFAEVAPGLEVPAGIEAIVRKCLAKRPDDRYDDVGGLMRDLRVVIGLDPSGTTGSLSIGGSGLVLPSGLDTSPGVGGSSPTLLPPDQETAPAPASESGGGDSRLLLMALLALVFVGGAGAMFMMYSVRKGAEQPAGVEVDAGSEAGAGSEGAGTEAEEVQGKPEAAGLEGVEAITEPVEGEEPTEAEASEAATPVQPKNSGQTSRPKQTKASSGSSSAKPPASSSSTAPAQAAEASEEGGSSSETTAEEPKGDEQGSDNPAGYMGLPEDFLVPVVEPVGQSPDTP